jgi:hypothetical protein
MIQKRLSFLAASLLIAPLSFAEPAPSPAPTKNDIPALIKQLGDDSPKSRDQASEKLRHLGADALPALSDAEKSEDPEVVSRAQTLTRQINEDLHPKPRIDPNSPQLIFPGGRGRGGFIVGPANGNISIQIATTVTNGNGRSVSVTKTKNGTVKETTVKEDGKTTKIREDAEGIAVTISEMKDGKEVSETTKAKDKDTLKKEHPKIFEIYEKDTKEGVRINGVPGQLRIKAGHGPVDLEKFAEDARKRANEDFKRIQKMEEEMEQMERRAEEAKPGDHKKADAPEVPGADDAASK